MRIEKVKISESVNDIHDAVVQAGCRPTLLREFTLALLSSVIQPRTCHPKNAVKTNEASQPHRHSQWPIDTSHGLLDRYDESTTSQPNALADLAVAEKPHNNLKRTFAAPDEW